MNIPISDNKRILTLLRCFVFPLILVVGAYMRFTGLDWDERRWIHPDEGHMRMVTSAIRMPEQVSDYFDTRRSPLNPRNNDQIYSYGTLPLFLTRATAEWLERGCGDGAARLPQLIASTILATSGETCRPGAFTFVHSALIGRFFSALADMGTVVLIYLLGRRLYGEAVGVLAMGLGATTVLLIQQAHFFTVDSLACFFTTLTAYFSVRGGMSRLDHPAWLDFALAGIATGLATASKVSAALAALLVALGGLWWWVRESEKARERKSEKARERKSEKARERESEKARERKSESKRGPWFGAAVAVGLRLVVAGGLSLLVFRVAQPYAFEGPGFFGVRRSPEWFARLEQIREEQMGVLDFPSGRQWANRLPVIFPWVNIVVWGMGLPLGVAAWVGWAVVGLELLRGKLRHMVPWVWVTLFFTYQATQWVKAMRYFLVLYPLLILMAAYVLVRLCRSAHRVRRWVGGVGMAFVVTGTALWALAFFSIYLRAHTRLAASRWIYEHVPAGMTVANEHWDWGLPIPLDGHNPFAALYTGIEMQHYNEDTPEKRTQLLAWLDQADYIFIASNRLYASIPRLPARYPLTIAYYRALFAGELGFDLVADFTSYPALGPLRFPDQETPFPLMAPAYRYQKSAIDVRLPPAEESFSVYDHPRVLIFKKSARYSHAEAAQRFDQVDLTQVQPWQRALDVTPPAYVAFRSLWLWVALGLLLRLGWGIFRQ